MNPARCMARPAVFQFTIDMRNTRNIAAALLIAGITGFAGTLPLAIATGARQTVETVSGPFIQITAGYGFACGLRRGGTVACWGADSHGEAKPPSGKFAQVSAGSDFACGVRASGRLACWGDRMFGETSSPSGIFTRVSVSGEGALPVA